MFAWFYFWWPKMTGTMLNSRTGKVQFWLMFAGGHGLLPSRTTAQAGKC